VDLVIVDLAARPAEPEIAKGCPAPVEATPPENRLEMPVQSFRSWKASEARKPAAPQAWRTPWLARAFVFGGAWALTAYGAW
jgi:membrane glycosyltransferase